ASTARRQWDGRPRGESVLRSGPAREGEPAATPPSAARPPDVAGACSRWGGGAAFSAHRRNGPGAVVRRSKRSPASPPEQGPRFPQIASCAICEVEAEGFDGER